MAALGTASLDDSPTGAGLHAVTETVLALTAAYIRLISAFHKKGNPNRGVGGRR